MGVTFSCPLAAYFDLDNAFDSAIVKSLTCKNDFHHHRLSGNFKIQDSESNLFESFLDSGKMLNEEDQQLSGSINKQVAKMPILNSSSPKHEAAIKLQKVYKSFRTRRKLADCAVLIEQSWWKLLDFAELKHSSISFFDLDKHESAISRWARARTRAAKVGKGLSKNCKAQKLALQHWLEAIDPRHRYGHNLHFYYMNWLHSQSKEPFFYWLDIGEGKEVNLIEKCPRAKLQQQCIKYLGPMERKAYEVAVEDGKLFYKQTGEFLDTSEEPKAKWIFVLSTTRTLYVSKKKKGSFQHSSFLAGGATLAAGRMVVDEGVLKAVWPHSGHYRPTPENFQDFILFLKENNVDLSDVKLDCADEDEDSFRRAESSHLRSNSSDEDLEGKDGLYTEDNNAKESTLKMNNSTKVLIPNAMELAEPKPLIRFGSKLTNLQIPSKEDFIERLKNENQEADLEDDDNSPPDSPVDEYETGEEESESESFAYEKIPNNHSVKGLKETQVVEASLSQDSVLEKINSVKGSSSSSNSYQLGKQLSCKWSTGAGPRIGCVREYPSELQCHALEQVNLSPRSARSLRLIIFPSESLTPTRRLSPLGSPSSSFNQISRPCRTRSSPLCT